NCPGATVTFSMTGATTASGSGSVSGRTFNKGVTTVTYTAHDTSGHTDNCNFTVTVNDTEDPSVSCPGNKVVSTDPGDCTAVVDTIDPTFSDNCPGATVTFTLTGAT